LVALLVESKQLDLKTRRCARGAVAYADRSKVEQIVINLISNAVKFTGEGGTIELTCETQPQQIVLKVRDTGIGIPSDQIESIFEPFVQVGRSLAKPKEGTGLGLAISRDLARAMHGELSVESVEGEGATFTLALPVPPQTEAG
jgi:signal transduction histidine kinase